MTALRRLAGVVALAVSLAGAQETKSAETGPAYRIAGRVLSTSGAAIAGATVGASLDNWRARDYFAPVVEFAATAKTDADGAFTIPVPVDCSYHLMAQAPGRARVWVGVEPASGLEIRLPLGGAIRGRVVDRATRQPIEGAKIDDVVSARDGSFLLEHLPPGTSHLRATHPAYVPSAWAQIGVEDGVTVDQDFALDPGETADGSVIDREGRPVSGATIAMTFRWGAPTGTKEFVPDEKTVVSDAQGKFTLRGMQPVEVWLEVRAKGLGAWSGNKNLARSKKIPPIVLEPERRVAGRVTSLDGEAVAGAKIRAGARIGDHLRLDDDEPAVTTAADGSFVVPGLPSKTSGFDSPELQVRHPSFGDAYVPLAGDTSQLAIRLGPGLTIEGVVSDETGSALPGARLELFEKRAGDVFWSGRVTGTDARGRFYFAHLAEGPYEVHVRAPGRLVERSKLSLSPETDPVFLELWVRKGKPVRGLVVDAAGDPVSSARVQIWNDHGSWTGATSLQGEFAASPMDDGPWTVHVDADGFVKRSFENATRDPNGVVRVVLERTAKVRILVVEAATSRPIPGAFVVMESATSGSCGSFETGDDGSGEATALCADFVLEVRKAGFATSRLSRAELDASRAAPAVIALAPGGALSGTLPVPRFNWAEFAVLARRAGAPTFEAIGEADHEGRFRIEGVAAGELEVAFDPARASDRLPEPRPKEPAFPRVARGVVVATGETTAVTFPDATKPATLEVRCALRTGDTESKPSWRRNLPGSAIVEPLDGQILGFADKGPGRFEPVPSVTADLRFPRSKASARLTLPPGRYRVRATAEGFADAAPAIVELAPDGIASVDLALTLGAQPESR